MKHSKGFLKLVEDALSRVAEVSTEQVSQKLERGDDFDLVDCREESEWQAGHARGAIHIGKGVIERDIEEKIPDPNREIVIYCGGGFRSALAADALQKMGYRNVKSMAGGIREWRQKGFPEER